MARDYDGLHLTEKGQWDTHMGRTNLYGWDMESTLWFKWPGGVVRPLGDVE